MFKVPGYFQLHQFSNTSMDIAWYSSHWSAISKLGSNRNVLFLAPESFFTGLLLLVDKAIHIDALGRIQ